ncbi:hypothetical protein TNIN_130721 [Trichonephila inaurata madagascariensis]|uniref:Uncharacterized protein n=1 Tax=Trichonephila inaurata madagascariensis TaxID=2747483 RepID=A0A8X6WT57_9ARAC|nr:hypothetical protein TNIN_130721 [Trichonephila inaurata madagascariensis]
MVPQFAGAVRLVRTVRLTRHLLRMARVFRRLIQARRLFGMLHMMILRRRGPKFLKTNDICLKRLACEIFTKPEPKVDEDKDVHYDEFSSNSRQFNSNGIKIFFNMDSLVDDRYCKDRFRSCPLNSMQILKKIMSIKSIGNQLIPLLPSPNNGLGSTKISIFT